MSNSQSEHAERPIESLGVFLVPLMRVGLKRKRLVGAMTLSIIVLAFTIALLLPKQYKAAVVIMPPQQSSSSGAALMAQMGNLGAMASAAGGMVMKNPNDQQVALLRSRTVEDAMVARFDLQSLYHTRYASSARRHWERTTATDDGAKDGLIRLSVIDHNPNRAANMANAWVDEYRRFTATLAITEASQRRLFFERQLEAAHEDLARAEDDVKRTEERTGIIDIEGQDHSMIASAAVLRGQLAAKQIEIRAMREFAADQNPDLQRAQEEAAGLEAQLAAMDAASERSTGNLAAPKGNVTQAGLDYTRALREVKYRETIQDLLTRQYEGARVDEARQGVMVQIVDVATIPDRPFSLRKILIMVGALVVALPVALLIAAGIEMIAILLRKRKCAGSWSALLDSELAGAKR